MNDGNTNLDIGSSLSLPIGVIDSEMVCCLVFVFPFIGSDISISFLLRNCSMNYGLADFFHGQCVHVNNNVWDQQMEKYRQKSPSTIELLTETQCQELEIDGVCVNIPSCFRYINRTVKLLLGNSLMKGCHSLRSEPIYTLFLTSFSTCLQCIFLGFYGLQFLLNFKGISFFFFF